MAEYIKVPIVKWDSASWAALNFFGKTHFICGEDYKVKAEKYTFLGQHRVRLYAVKGNVHWKIPQGINLDVSEVPKAIAPRRMPRR
jgi:hypothetical protein